MEAMSAYSVTPQAQHSHVRHTTRPMQHAEPQPLSAPASQESFVSVQSQGSSVPSKLESNSSTLSQLTNYSDLTAPSIHSTTRNGHDGTKPTSAAPARRDRTPEDQMNKEYALASPMSVTSPATTNGAKRTASGHVKNAPSLPSTPMTATFGGRARGESISSTGSRAGDLAATLKTRLGYAMAKVQHGWEHKNIAEIEQLAAQKASPNRHSMSHLDYSRRPVSAGLSNGTAQLSMYENYGYANGYNYSQNGGIISPPSKRRSGTFSSIAPNQQRPYSLNGAAHLQPPVDIKPNVSRTYHPSQPTNPYNTSAMSPPRTPINNTPRRPPTLRTDTQTAEAERDALQALFQLGSPHASSQMANASQASSSQASPLRTEYATPRKVTFARSDSEGSSISGRGV